MKRAIVSRMYSPGQGRNKVNCWGFPRVDGTTRSTVSGSFISRKASSSTNSACTTSPAFCCSSGSLKPKPDRQMAQLYIGASARAAHSVQHADRMMNGAWPAVVDLDHWSQHDW